MQKNHRTAVLIAWIVTVPGIAVGEERGSGALEEVVVTATKRGAQTVLETPMAITAFGGDTLEQTGADQLSDFLMASPGVTVSDINPGNQVIQIRGISSVFGDSTVGLYLDDVPFAAIVNLEMPQTPTFDLERVEVLRGPQGTLYGASSQGGTIRVLTKDADPNAFDAKADLSYGEIDGGESVRRLNGAINLPLVDGKLAIRLVAGVNDVGGFVDDSSTGRKDVNDTKTENYRAKVKFTPNDRLTLKASAWLQRLDADGPNIANDDMDRPYGVLFPIAGIDKEFAKFSFDAYNFVVDYDFDSVNFYSASSYLKFDESQIDLGTFVFDDRKIKNFSQEVRLSSRGESIFQWTLGAFYNDNETHFLFSLNPFGPPGFGLPVDLVVVDETSGSKSTAIFGEGTWELFDRRLAVTAGLRYYRDKRDDLEEAAFNLPILQLAGLSNFRKAKYETVQPKLNVSYKPTEGLMVYGNVARGFRSGLIQPAGSISSGFFTPVPAQVPPDVKEESLWSYEVGGKLSSLEGRLSVEAAVYLNEWKDIQTFGAFPPLPGFAPIAFAFNGPSARSYGFDWAINFQPIPRLQLSFSGNVNKSEYTADAAFVDPNGVVAPGSLLDGDPIVYVPDLTLAASLTYRPRISAWDADGLLFAGVQHNSERKYAPNDAESQPNTFVSLRVGIEKGQFGIYAFADNVTNESGSLYPASPESAAVGSVLEPRPTPRTFGLNLQWRLR